MRRVFTGAALILLPAALLAGGVARNQKQQRQPQKVRLEGYVFDSGGKPLGGVKVSVWVVGKSGSVAGTRTAPDTGKYEFEADVKTPFEISYSLTNFDYSIVSLLADKKSQQISKVLYRDGEPMPASAAHALLQSADRIAFLTLSLPPDQRREFISNLAEVDIPDNLRLDRRINYRKDTSIQLMERLRAQKTLLRDQVGTLGFKVR